MNIEQRQQMERQLGLENPQLVFTGSCEGSGSEEFQAVHPSADARLALDTGFEALPLDTEYANVLLEPIASTLSLRELRLYLHRCARLLKVGGEGHLVMANPDHLRDLDPACWPGQPVSFEGELHRYRPLRQWWELLRLFPLEPKTPIAVPAGDVRAKFLWLRFERTNTASPLAQDFIDDDQKYGTDSSYRRFDRLEEPEIFDDWCYAASKLRPRPGETVLSLGCNDGREFEMFRPEQQNGARFVGIDVSQSAIDSARQRYAHEFHCHDLMELQDLELGQVHIALLLNVLQCTSLDRDSILNRLMKQLSSNARLLISVPNCHFGARDILRRPLDRRSKRHDRSLIHKDLRYLTRFFFRNGFSRIESFGTYDAFLLVQR
ncbi:MAG: class I SAM-dependent methyltransferase [Planctomycetota bacterium]|nr:class I SAM-dependent methyltransferase [Planctomycetota bacterium]